MASETAADILIERLVDWGVEVMFGMPGDGINGIMEALRKRADRIRFIQVRHEEAAAFMACAYAKYSGRLGVCLATSGPGGLHLLNGLYDAKLDGQPVLAITGLQFHDLIGTSTQQDVELDKVFMDVAEFNGRIMGSAHVENLVDVACRTALSYRSDEQARSARLPERDDGRTRMANGLPYAIAAQIAHPDRLSVAFVGDGGLSMLLGELATCVKYQLNVKIVVIKNNSLGMIKWEQMVFLGNPEFACELQPIDFAAAARAFGVTAFSIGEPRQCAAVMEQALATTGPVLVEATVDPHEPPMPPSLSVDDAKNFAASLLKGQPNRKRIALTAASDKVRELL